MSRPGTVAVMSRLGSWVVQDRRDCDLFPLLLFFSLILELTMRLRKLGAAGMSICPTLVIAKHTRESDRAKPRHQMSLSGPDRVVV